MKTHFIPLAVVILLTQTSPAATQVDLPGPPGSGEFGRAVTVLPNGNFVVTDPFFDNASGVVDVGAVYLYTPEGALISTLRGSSTDDQVGINGILVLANGNFVVGSPNWDNGVAANAGAVTWGSAVSGFIGGQEVIVSAANSLVGSTTNDTVGAYSITALTNGNYVVSNPDWDNGVILNAGAATWGNGFIGTTGPVTPANSLVGSTTNDGSAGFDVRALTNGNYVVRSPFWNNTAAAATDAGAVTWGNGLTGISGPITSSNSLVGTTMDSRVGGGGITALTNGHYVAVSTSWRNGAVTNAGAITWGNGFTGIIGPVSDTNSLVGTTTLDQVGSSGVTALTNGNYVVRSSNWDNTAAAAVNAGAVTWGNGTTGITGPVTPANSLVGTTASDSVGSSGVTALNNGNYVVSIPLWDNTAPATVDAGAATWGNGLTGISGPVTAANSLVGTTPNDQVGIAVNRLTSGNYVVISALWDNGPNVNAGAATWGNGTTGITGQVSPSNSLVGSTTESQIGSGGIAALTQGHYVVRSPLWDNGSTLDVGAATWGNGIKGITGPVSAANSLIGSTADDKVSSFITPLTNGNYVVCSPSWDNGVIADAGAVTWSSGAKGITGFISSANSLVGSTASDSIGSFSAFALPNGHYVVRSPNWNNAASDPVGAATWGNGLTGITGSVSAANSLIGSTLNDQVGSSASTFQGNSHYLLRTSNWDNGVLSNSGAITLGDGEHGTAGEVGSRNSVLGTVANGGSLLVASFDPARKQLIVGRQDSNLVTLFRGDQLRSLGLSGQPAPGAADIAYAKPGSAAVNALGHALADFTLTGSGASKGRNRALFALSPTTGIDLVLQSGTALSALGGSLPSNTVATTLHSQVFHQPNRGLFQATVKGTGISATNNRLLLLDNGIGVSLLHRSGQPIGIGALANASVLSFTEILQSHDTDLITLAYKLKSGGGINAGNDEGLLFLDHSGVVGAHIATREGQPAFGGGGTFGAFNGRAAASLGSTIHFTALFKPTSGKPLPALFSTTADGLTTARLAQGGELAPFSGGATINTFTALSQQGPNALVKATLKGGPSGKNEGLYLLPSSVLLTRKGDDIGGGTFITRILRFWPAGLNQVILLAQIGGTGGNSQALLLRQNDEAYLILLRTGTVAPGTGPAKLKSISAVEVNPVSGRYAVLGTLSGSPANANQALWTGNPTLGDDSPPALQDLRKPQLTLRKGNVYSTEVTPHSLIRSLALKPALDPTGAGGRGLAQALGELGDLAIYITGDRKLTELVILDR